MPPLIMHKYRSVGTNARSDLQFTKLSAPHLDPLIPQDQIFTQLSLTQTFPESLSAVPWSI